MERRDGERGQRGVRRGHVGALWSDNHRTLRLPRFIGAVQWKRLGGNTACIVLWLWGEGPAKGSEGATWGTLWSDNHTTL